MATSLSRVLSAPLIALALALVLLVGTQPEPAAAAVNQYWSQTVSTGQGGTGQTQVITDTLQHSISIRSWVIQNNGGRQDLRACVSSLENNVWYSLPCRYGTSQNGNCGVTCIFNEGPVVIAPGWHKVSVWYGWLRQSGWYNLLGEVGWVWV
jgi:hypothetical protein